jgi:hypothetical protein
MPDNTPDLGSLAKSLLLARSAFNKAYIHHWHATEPCDDATGRRLLVLFREQIKKFVFDYERKDVGVEHAADEIFRRVLTGEANYTFAEACGFVRWYGKLKGRISRAVGHLFEHHGDSFGDLCDSYPLADQDLVERALASHPKSKKPRRDGFLDEKEMRDAVLEKIGLRWHKFICKGENYIESALEKAAKLCYLHRVMESKENVTWSEAELEAANFAYYDD